MAELDVAVNLHHGYLQKAAISKHSQPGVKAYVPVRNMHGSQTLVSGLAASQSKSVRHVLTHDNVMNPISGKHAVPSAHSNRCIFFDCACLTRSSKLHSQGGQLHELPDEAVLASNA